ncbi:TetR/AcrR family transcriptional regulator [Echinicola vietnamensis]|uniref:Transcriptional regulator n=1 Tax=Echinicola vietnamensis (strain DSM 17526 / LMG 23754 / KMM 6221) TaxID=926556 RepID=L0G1H4_ECHVK|nr:TetR/AcrR family transcriptional regulator [Echinicola vietnamensis]AGA78861.1 transcriptional regulator [Echinicola vietnamensis DSM 17526]
MKKAEITRSTILNKAFDLIYTNGYRATSIDEILATTKVTKGAFYYHFKNKDEMGIAMVEEILKPRLSSKFVALLGREDSPQNAIYALMQHLLLKDDTLTVACGCPASNLVQEMTPWDTSFSKALNELVNQWIRSLTDFLENGQKNGSVHNTINPASAALFILSGYWGARNLGKLENSKRPYHAYLDQLTTYLNTLT